MKQVNLNTALLLVVIVLLLLVLVVVPKPAVNDVPDVVQSTRTRTATPPPEPSNTPSATPTINPAVTLVISPTPSPTPGPIGDNLLINGDFFQTFTPWAMDCTDCWRLSTKPNNPSPTHTEAECDQDLMGGQIVGWQIGTAGRLWQDVNAPNDHSYIAVSMAEVQHHGENNAAWRLYGSNGDEWEELWSRTEFGDDVPYNTASNRATWYYNTYTTTVAIPYEAYRVEASCEITACLAEDEDCGWKFTLLSLRTD